MPQRCVEALRQHMKRQEKERLRAGELWQEHGLVFTSRIGTPLSANNVIRAFNHFARCFRETWLVAVDEGQAPCADDVEKDATKKQQRVID